MPLFDTPDGLVLTQEGTSVRARAGRCNCLFRDRTPAIVLEEYNASIAKVGPTFEPRADSAAELITKEETADLIQEVALHTMYFYVVNRLPVCITDDDLSHPQTKSIVWEFAKRKFGENDSRVSQFCAKMLSINEEDFEKWLCGWKLYLDR